MALNNGQQFRVKLSLEIMAAIESAAGVDLPASSRGEAKFRQWRAAQLVKIYCALEVGDGVSSLPGAME